MKHNTYEKIAMDDKQNITGLPFDNRPGAINLKKINSLINAL